MLNRSDYQNVLFGTNFIGGAGKNDLSTISEATNIRAEVIKIGNKWQLNYFLIEGVNDLNALGYYDSSDREYTQMPSEGPGLSELQKTVIETVLQSWRGNPYSVTYEDVAPANYKRLLRLGAPERTRHAA